MIVGDWQHNEVYLHRALTRECWKRMLSIIGRCQAAVDAAPRLVRKEIFSRMKWDSITCVEEFDNDTYKGNIWANLQCE